MEEYDITYRLSKDGFSDAVASGQTPERNEGQGHENIWGNSIPCSKDSKAKALRRVCAQCPQGTGKKVMWLESSE